MRRKINCFTNILLLLSAALYVLLLLLPYKVDNTLSGQYELSESETSFVITPDHRLVMWNPFDDHNEIPGPSFKPYFLRKTVLRNVAKAYAGNHIGMALDRDGTLWGWGSMRTLVNDEGSGQPWRDGPVQLMDNVVDFSGTGYSVCIAFLKTDGSLWVWDKQGQTSEPLQLAENIRSLGGWTYCVDENDVCWRFDNMKNGEQTEWQRVRVAENIEACADWGELFLLTKDGVLRTEKDPVPLMENVTSLRANGFYADGGWWRIVSHGNKFNLERLEDGMAVGDHSLGITETGRVIGVGALPVPKSLYTVSPWSRDLCAAALAGKMLLYIFRPLEKGAKAGSEMKEKPQ